MEEAAEWQVDDGEGELLFDTGEGDDWELGDLTFEGLKEDTTNLGPLYFWFGSPRRHQWPVFLAITREITPPWRRGFGLGFRFPGRHAIAVGLWFRSEGPDFDPEEKSIEDTIHRADELDGPELIEAKRLDQERIAARKAQLRALQEANLTPPKNTVQ